VLEGTPSLRSLAAIAALAAAVRLFAAWAIPFSAGSGDPNFAPDESQHFLVIRHLSEGRAPVWPDSPSVYSVFPPSQYAMQAATLWLGRALPDVRRLPGQGPDAVGIFWARAGSVLLGVAGSVLLARTAGAFLRDARAGILAGAAAALYPQYAFVTSYCNADACTIFAGVLLVDALATWAVRGEGAAGLGYVGAAAGAVLSGKVSGFYLLLPATILVLSRRPPLRALLRSCALAAFVAGPWLLWNAVRTGGDAFGVRLYGKLLADVWRPQTLLEIPHGATKFAYLMASSAIGVFGNMSLPLPWALRGAIGAVVLAGVLIAARTRPWSPAAKFIAGAALANLGSELAKCLLVDFQPQGRYVLVPVLLLICVAVIAPARHWRRWPAVFLAVLAVSTLTMEWQLFARGR
jgi:4-amino-4-deoxy-L-arabinose transferase-like glycosyltransferase